MKKFSFIAALLIFALLLTACGYSTPTITEERDALRAENEVLRTELDALRGTQTPQERTMTGYFVATVRGVIPDYVLDDKTPSVAVVTLFQDIPFAVRLGPDIAARVRVGETYCFFIEDRTVDLTGYPDPDVLLDPATALRLAGIRVAEVQPAEEGDGGLDCCQLHWREDA